MTRMYLVRHAEAEGNLYRRIHGWYDALITDNGYRQIEALEARFNHIHVDAVYSSDLFRTKTTASAVWRPKGLSLTTMKGLREIHLGVWEDRTWGDVGYQERELLARFNHQDPTFHIEGGETFDQLRARMERSLRAIAANHPGQTVAVFSHGTAIRNALALFLGLSVEETNQLGHSDNTAVSLLEFDGDRVTVVFQDDNSHLSEDISTLARQSWWKNKGATIHQTNLWFRPMDLFGAEGEDYLRAREDAWLRVHADLDGFDGEGFLAQARDCARREPASVLRAMLEDEPVGLLELDPERGAEKGVGAIPFCYLDPAHRRKGLGVQLIGQAVSAYRPRGREYLRLYCAPENQLAQRFYARHGFRRIGQGPGARGMLDLLEKYIGYKDLRE